MRLTAPRRLLLPLLLRQRAAAAPLQQQPRLLATRAPPPPPPLWYSEADLEEQFVRGGGRGGQSVAKTSNCVILKHVPTGTQVRCHATRSCETNRRLARKELQLRLDELHRGAESVRSVRGAKDRRRAQRATSKARARHEHLAELKQLLVRAQGDPAAGDGAGDAST